MAADAIGTVTSDIDFCVTEVSAHKAHPDPNVLAALNERWRVVVDPLQWIVQYRRNNRGRSGGSEDPRSWEGRSFCRTRTALLRCIGEYCGEVDPSALSIIKALPEWHVELGN